METLLLARTLAPAQQGMTSRLISIECDITNGLPAFIVVGLADKAIDEAKERVRGALRHAGLVMPPKRITLNLAPADLPKDGTGFDLGIAVSILAATGQLTIDVRHKLFVGELGLDGAVRPIRGALSHAQAAKVHGLTELYVPAVNAAEAALCKGLIIYAVTDLQSLYKHLSGEAALQPYQPAQLSPPAVPNAPDLAEVRGQAVAKRALEIAAAGHHNILLSGPPGAGKTMLARALVGILPPLEFDELVQVNQLHSIVGGTERGLITARPFRNPHHTASSIALIGGGGHPKPGEISLAHRGVLFLDELPEFPRFVLEVLRQPLEDGQVTIARARDSITYPARFMLVATQNPCPCGFLGDSTHSCSCTLLQIRRYQQRVSGPLLDRIDLVVSVQAVPREDMTPLPGTETSQVVAARVAAAHRRQVTRYGSSHRNAEMTNAEIARHAKLDPATERVANQAVASLALSARGYMRMLRVARTIADLAGSPTVLQNHFTEALQYRPPRD